MILSRTIPVRPVTVVMVVMRYQSGRLESAVVPGFWIETSWLWQDPLPSTAECLEQIVAS